ncbi:20s-pre-rrna d-site endonuclease nob1 [Diaporthe amygdali]|uniref:20s-pre-rrna d-site endonuclease nob1 n=1 Tax=Phomopsis amygdali TaxID=1214568 RepID=UPI0022FE68C7|nr:20s-pre-rrna d-site endonuclease nob1 [Diaporthe amygdali]KAJ0114225.1 20s-pre-rrna d-site endonuclease nob1 [Diaporthe amygdali]
MATAAVKAGGTSAKRCISGLLTTSRSAVRLEKSVINLAHWTPSEAVETTLQAAILTWDFAMQNVALRINLFLVSPSNTSRIENSKIHVLRCSARSSSGYSSSLLPHYARDIATGIIHESRGT